MFKTRVCSLLNIDYPIMQGGMAWVADGILAAAVSNAGGLGIIGAGHAPPEVVEKEIEKAMSLTKRSFGVNIMLLSPFADEIVNLVVEYKVKVVTTGAGSPGKYMDKLKTVARVIPVVASVALAKRMQQIGADAVVAEGLESGGHIGEISTMALVPQVADAVDIPVIAAGGIADGRGFLAALALGAEGVQMGTRFILSEECTVHPNYKQALLKAKDRDTVVTGLSTGHPTRVVKNRLAREFALKEKQGVSAEELEELGSGKLYAAAREGDVVGGSVMAGQICGLIKDIKPVGKVIKDIIEEARMISQSLNNLAG
ncbi:MAG: enoyl-[acyl-carrier-protein] reductase FabK [Deltaproteobacteria bacterium]|nr:enoyl-[acyl-carrier-protein] reductase FabK [Deltaproteobacteria bacterium]